MKTLFRSIAMAFSMFSVLPTPMVEWKRENMKYMLCALPLVGIVMVPFLWVWQLLCRVLSVGNVLYAAGLTLIPLAISGGIHMDGFCDTVDARSSHASPERKREILKDSRAGAFAVIWASAWFLLYTALGTEVEQSLRAVLIVGIHHVFARSMSAFAGVVFPSSNTTGTLAAFRDGAGKRAVLILGIWYVVCVALLVWLAPVSGVVSAAAGVGLLWYLFRMAKREFGGMSGDLAGYLTTLAELVLLFCYIFSEKVVSLCF